MAKDMNETQLMWLEIIHRVITAPRFDLAKGDLNYVLRNMLAKFTSSTETYYVSVGVEELINRDEILSAEFAKRAPIDLGKLFYGKASRSTKLGFPTMFEHTVPVAVLRNELLKVRERYLSRQLSEDTAFDETKQVLSNCGEVVIVLKEENKRLSRATMPEGWIFGEGCSFARYEAATPPVKIGSLIAYRNESIRR